MIWEEGDQTYDPLRLISECDPITCALYDDKNGTTFMFGENNAVVNSISIPHEILHKRHILLSFHGVRESIESKMLKFIFIPGC